MTALDKDHLEDELDHINSPMPAIMHRVGKGEIGTGENPEVHVTLVQLSEVADAKFAVVMHQNLARSRRCTLDLQYVGGNPNTRTRRLAVASYSKGPASMIRMIVCGLAYGFAAYEAQATTADHSTHWARPNVQSISRGNAAGVLQYCMARQLVSRTNAGMVIEELTKERDMTHSPDFKAGQSGQIVGKHPFTIGSAPGFIQSEACDS